MAAPARKRKSKRTPREVVDPRVAAVEAALGPGVTAVLARFRIVFRSVRRHNQFLADRCGLDAMQVRALALVLARDGIGVSALADALFIHQPSASKLVDALGASDLIKRVRSTNDRRKVELRITAAGRKLLSKVPDPAFGVLPDALGRLRPTELRELDQLLESLIDAMRFRDARGGYVPLSDS